MTTTATPKKKVVKKTTSKSPSVKKHPKGKGTGKGTKKKTAKASTNGKVEYGVEKSSDLPWNDKKVAVFKALRQLKAVSGPLSAVSAKSIATKANVNTKDARHYCYHAKVSGLVGIADIENVRGYAFFLTAKGTKVNPDEAKKKQDTKKK